MSRLLTAWIFWTMVEVCLAGLGIRAEEGYEVTLARFAAPGDTYRLSTTASTKGNAVSVTTGMTNRNDQELKFDLEGVVEVLDVDSKGRQRRIVFTIGHCLAKKGRDQISLFNKGDRILLEERNRLPRFSLDGQEVSRLANQALLMALAIKLEDSPDPDEVFEIAGRKKVGDRWPINPAAALEWVTGLGSTGEPAKMSGECWFNGVRQIEGRDYRELTATIISTNLPFAQSRTEPPWRAELEMKFWSLAPADGSGMPSKDSVYVRMTRMSPPNHPGEESSEFSEELVVKRTFGDFEAQVESMPAEF